MTHAKTTQIKKAYEQYKKSNCWELFHCYDNYSRAKENAMQYCKDLMQKYNGYGLYMIGSNSMTFSVGFIGKIPDNKTGEIKEAFCYITKSYDRYIFIDEI